MCSLHGHQWVLSFEVSTENCFICLLDTLENTNESHLLRESIYIDILNKIVSNNQNKLAYLICNEILLLEKVIHTFLILMVEIDNESFVETVSATITVLYSISSDTVFEIFAQQCSSICFSAPNFKSCILITKLLAKTVNGIDLNIVLFLEKEFFLFLINGLENPDNIVKLNILHLMFNLMKKNLELEGNLLVFSALFPKLNFLMSLSENLEVIEKSLNVLEIASKSKDFLDWIYNHNNINEVNAELEIKKMFTTLKKIFYFREAVVNSKNIKILYIILQKQEYVFIKTFLETNIIEFLYDIIRSTFDYDVIELIMKIISELNKHNIFFSNCYAALGIPSVCKALETLMTAKLDNKVILGLETLASMLENQSEQASFTNNISFFDQIFQTVNDAVNYGLFEVLIKSCMVLKVFQHEKYFPFPLPEEELRRVIEDLDHQYLKHLDNLMVEGLYQPQLSPNISSLSLLFINIFSFLKYTYLRLVSVYGKLFYESKFSNSILHLLTYKWLPNFNSYKLNHNVDNQVIIEVLQCITTYLSCCNPKSLLYKDLFNFAGSTEMVKLSLRLKANYLIEGNNTFDTYIITVLYSFFESVDCASDFKFYDQLIKIGVQNIKGYNHEILEYLKEPSLSKELICIQTVVISLLSLTYFVSETSSIVSPSKIKNILIIFISSELSICNIPSCFIQFVLYLLGIAFECEEQPKLPSYLVKDLFKDNHLNFLHPLTVKFIVKSPSIYIKSKSNLILHCLSFKSEDNIKIYIRCLIDVAVSLDSFILDTVFESVMIAGNKKNHEIVFNLIEVLNGVATITPLSSSFFKNLHNVTDDILNVNLAVDKSRCMLACWVDLIRTVVENSIYENDHKIYLSKIINRIINLLKGIHIVETNKAEVSIVICSVIRLLTSYVLNGEELYQSLDMSLVFSEVDWILKLVKGYSKIKNILSNYDLISSIYAFLSVIINHSKNSINELPSSIQKIEISVNELLNCVKSNEFSLQIGGLLLWSSLFDCNFENPFLRLTNIKDKSLHEVVQTESLNPSVLNQTDLMVLYNCCLTSLTQSSQTKSSASKCIYSMIMHAKLHLKYAVHYFVSSPWLHLILSTYNDSEFDDLSELISSF